MDEKENHMLEGFKRGKSARDIFTCRQVLNIIVFLGFMVNYMLRVNLTFAIVDMVVKRENNSTHNHTSTVALSPETFESNRTRRSLPSFTDSAFLELQFEDDVTFDQLDDEDEVKLRHDGGTVKHRRSSDQVVKNDSFISSNLTGQSDQNRSLHTNETAFKSDYVIRFAWSESQVGFVLGSFFWGYLCTEIPGGRLAELIGVRKVFGYATLGASVLTLLAPLCAKIHFVLLLVNRIAMGAFLGPTWPAILPLAAKWIPADERGKFLSNMMASTLGAAFTLPICGFIIANSSWEYVFYLTGLIGFVWSICWFLLVYDSPATHPRISDEERFYIESKLGVNNVAHVEKDIPAVHNSHLTQALIRDHEKRVGENAEDLIDSSDNEMNVRKSKKLDYTSVPQTDCKNGINGGATPDVDEMRVIHSPTSVDNRFAVSGKNGEPCKRSHHSQRRAPWLSILTSVPVWAFVLTHGASVFGYFTITNQLPTFMKHILNYNIKENGILSGLPYLGKYLSALIGGSIADHLIRSSTLSRNTVRKMFTCIGVMIPGCIMVMQIFLGSNKILSIVIFTLTMIANGFVTGGYLGNSLELAPNYSGTIFGLANMLSGLCGSLSAFLVGYLTENNQVYGQWQKVFAVVAIFYFCGAVIFLFFGSTKTQAWDSPEESSRSTHKHSKRIRTER